MENTIKTNNAIRAIDNILCALENNAEVSILDKDLLYIYDDDGGKISLSKCISLEDRAKFLSFSTEGKLDEYKLVSTVNLKELLFGAISAISNLGDYSKEIDKLFNKRVYKIDENLIKSFSQYYRYIQLGYDVSSSIKLTLCILHDIGINKTLTSTDIMDLIFNTIKAGSFNFKGLIKPCGRDIINLLKTLNNNLPDIDIHTIHDAEALTAFSINVVIIPELLNFASNCVLDLNDECLQNLFAYKDYGLIDKMAGIHDTQELTEDINNFFNNDDFFTLKHPFDQIMYVEKSAHFAKRILKNTNFYELSMDIDSFTGALTTLPFVPDMFNRSDTQFIIYLMINHMYSELNKAFNNFNTKEDFDLSKKQLYISYKLSQKFGFEKKSLHDMAIVFYFYFIMLKDLENTIKVYLNNIIDNILHLKSFEASKFEAINDSFVETTKLQEEIDNLNKNIEDYKLDIANKANKKAYLENKKVFQDEIKSYKKEIQKLNKEIDNLKKSNNTPLEQQDIKECNYTKKETINLGTLNAAFVGDSNFDITLLTSLFNDVSKINGYTASTLYDPYTVMNKCDILIYQSKYMKHVSAEFIKAASDLNKTIIYIESCNPGLVVSEIYKQLYSN